MTGSSLVGRLLGWHVLFTACACVLLVAATMTATSWVLRARQDAELAELSRTVCMGIWHELAEPYPVEGIPGAARHYLEETRIEGVRMELWREDGALLAVSGTPVGRAEMPSTSGLPSSCGPEPAGPGEDRKVRACLQACDAAHFVRIAATDALTDPALRRSGLVLLVSLPLAVTIGALIGFVAIRRLLRPLDQLAQAAGTVVPGARMTLGVGTRSRELQRLERAFDALLARVGDALERERRFAQEASHELRTPLTNLRLRVERIERAAGEATDASGEVAAALRDLDALDRLLEGLLLLARAEEGDMPLATVNLCDVVRELTADPAEPWSDGAASIELDLPDEILVRGNEELLTRVVVNALDNARKYAGPGARVRVRAAEEGGYGVLTVEDGGPGIPAEARSVVFEPFFRGAAVRHRVEGTGLGLAVVQAVVRRHGGRVAAGPSPLGGMELRVEIPLVGGRSADVQVEPVQ